MTQLARAFGHVARCSWLLNEVKVQSHQRCNRNEQVPGEPRKQVLTASMVHHVPPVQIGLPNALMALNKDWLRTDR
jgi:hypothetical protein